MILSDFLPGLFLDTHTAKFSGLGIIGGYISYLVTQS